MSSDRYVLNSQIFKSLTFFKILLKNKVLIIKLDKQKWFKILIKYYLPEIIL